MKKAATKLRTTRTRTALLAALTRATAPLTATELLRQITTAGVTCDRVTIYRQLATLVRLGRIREELLDARATKYELIRSGQHQHHFVCGVCKQTTPFPTKKIEQALASIERIMHRKHFAVTRHSLALFGRCPNCKNS